MIKKIFKKELDIAIGVIHLPPLLGFKDFPGMKVAERNALKDLRAFEEGDFDAIMFENNYDVPHQEFVSPAVVAAMTTLGTKICAASKLPIGISVLWNDYRTAFSIAKIVGLQFIRVPVFVDKVKTAYGIIEGHPKEIITLRKQLEADNIALLTDIHVKHAKILSLHSLGRSAERAIAAGSDALIITGDWTGKAPNLAELIALRKKINGFPIFVGSGANKDNVRELCRYANGVIVSTALKERGQRAHEVNVKSYRQRISERKAKAFMRALHDNT